MKNKKIIFSVLVAGILVLNTFFLSSLNNNEFQYTLASAQAYIWNGTESGEEGESGNLGKLKPNEVVYSCGTHNVETWTWYGEDDWGFMKVLGTKVWIDGDLQSPYYDAYSDENLHDWEYCDFTSSYTEIKGTKTTCESGSQVCTPSINCKY